MLPVIKKLSGMVYSNRKVLFSGIPCTVLGVTTEREYEGDNKYTIELYLLEGRGSITEIKTSSDALLDNLFKFDL